MEEPPPPHLFTRKCGAKSSRHSLATAEAAGKRFDLALKDSMEARSRKSPNGVLQAGLRLPSPSPSSQWSSWLSRLLKPKSIRRSVTFPASTATEVATHGLTQSKSPWRCFSLSELKAATNNFSPENFVGKGGYAEVYKGCLEDGEVVAIKKLTRGTTEAQTYNFLSEVGIIVHLNHPNIAKLIGFCTDGGMHIVLQFSPLGSLSSHLHDREGLMWSVRYRIAVGTGQALEYLHYRCPRRIIHRDIKAANILLSASFEPQICDFGLAKWLPSQWTHHNLPSYEGTFGYLAPECIMHGIVDEKTDVFAFGVVLLELITGRRALDSSMNSLVIWARPLLEANDAPKLVDSSLGDSYDRTQFDRLAYLSSLCLRESAPLRPTMSNVLKILRAVDSSNSRSTDPRMAIRKTALSEDDDGEMLGLDEEYINYTRKYMNDLRIHKQITFDI